MSNHTPGPWTPLRMKLGPKQKDRRCGFVINGPDTGNPLPVRICDLRVPAGSGGFGEGKANARLISAAPELLATLVEIVGQENPNRWGYDAAHKALDDDWRDRARAAIAKATGEILEDKT